MREQEKTPLWRQHQSDKIMEVVTGLRNGDLKPFAHYLKSGGLPESPPDSVALPGIIADDLVAMIEQAPWHWFSLTVKSRKRGRGWSDDLAADDVIWRIGFFAEQRIRELG